MGFADDRWGLNPVSKLAGQVATVFKGTTLRSMLLNAYGWWKVSQLLYIAAIVALALGGLALIGSVFGFAAGFKEVFSAKATDAPGSGPVAAITNLDKMFASTELLFLLLSGLSIVWSIVNGIYLLNALPGAAQRVAANATARRSDIYSVRNDDGQDSISEMTSRFRWLFILGITLFAVFAAIRIIERFIRVIYS